MLYSYRHPDLAIETTENTSTGTAPEQKPEPVVERRRVVRPIPVPAVIESNDSDAWELWDQALEGFSK
jgi:hypothetical protein